MISAGKGGFKYTLFLLQLKKWRMVSLFEREREPLPLPFYGTKKTDPVFRN